MHGVIPESQKKMNRTAEDWPDHVHRVLADAGARQIAYVPDAEVTHLGGASSRQKRMRADVNVNFHAARLKFCRKHFGARAARLFMVAGMLESLCLLPVWAIRFLLRLGRDAKAKDQLIINLRIVRMYLGQLFDPQLVEVAASHV